MSRVGVVGAGTIGAGVAQALAQGGHDVVLVDRSEEALARAVGAIERGARLHHLAAGGPRLDAAEVSGRIEATTDPEALAGVEFAVENVPERWEAKRTVWEQLERICPPAAICAANTSAIPIARFAALRSRPDRVIGIHFMNPVPLKRAAEVIPGPATSGATVAEATALLASIGQRAIVVGDAPGFVSNRVLMLTVNEAAAVVGEGVAAPHEVDRVFKECFGHAMGPLETADLIGLDTVALTLEVLEEELGDPKFRPCALLASLVAAGKLGRKTGEGFHPYGSGARPEART